MTPAIPAGTGGGVRPLCVHADVNDYNLEAISLLTLIVHTKDDQRASHEASKRVAERIPGARFVSLESGHSPCSSSNNGLVTRSPLGNRFVCGRHDTDRD